MKCSCRRTYRHTSFRTSGVQQRVIGEVSSDSSLANTVHQKAYKDTCISRSSEAPIAAPMRFLLGILLLAMLANAAFAVAESDDLQISVEVNNGVGRLRLCCAALLEFLALGADMICKPALCAVCSTSRRAAARRASLATIFPCTTLATSQTVRLPICLWEWRACRQSSGKMLPCKKSLPQPYLVAFFHCTDCYCGTVAQIRRRTDTWFCAPGRHGIMAFPHSLCALHHG